MSTRAPALLALLALGLAACGQGAQEDELSLRKKQPGRR